MQRLELRIEALAAGGDGVAHAADGRVVFVPFTAPGDRVLVRLADERRSFARARVERLLEPGPARCEPVCAVFGSCGGCSWQHVAYDAQVAAKGRIVADALERIGGLPPGGPVRVVPSPQPYGYRGRTRVLALGGRVGYRRRRSRALCPVSRCPVLAPPLDARLVQLARERPADGEWELALGSAGGAEGEPAARASPLGAAAGERLFLDLGGDRIGFSPGVFAQSNALLLEDLARAVAEAAGTGAAALELYAGAGLFTLSLARRFGRVVAVEASEAAVRDLRANLADAGLRNVEVLERRVEDFAPEPPSPDALVLDPPRAGLPPGAAPRLAALAPRRIAYLSCDPATLARDAGLLGAAGYGLTSVLAFDLFPQTPHVEVLALLEPGRGEPQASGVRKS